MVRPRRDRWHALRWVLVGASGFACEGCRAGSRAEDERHDQTVSFHNVQMRGVACHLPRGPTFYPDHACDGFVPRAHAGRPLVFFPRSRESAAATMSRWNVGQFQCLEIGFIGGSEAGSPTVYVAAVTDTRACSAR